MNTFEKYVVFISFITSFFVVFVSNGITIALPSIANEFGMNNFVQNWIPTLLVFTITICTLPFGHISGKVGAKKSLIIGNSIFLIGLVMCCLSYSSEIFLFSRIIQGIGLALANVSEISIIVLAVSEENRGKAFGIIASGIYLGTSASPAICGFLGYNFGWRSIFYVAIPFIIICIALLVIKINKEWKPLENRKIDKTGALLYMLSMGLFIYGFTDLLTWYGPIMTVIGLILIVLFGIYESRIKIPIFEVKLFKNKAFASYNFAGFCGYFVMMMLITLFNYYFQYVKGWDAQLTGLILITGPVILAITAPLAGKLSDKENPQKIAITGILLAAIGYFMLSFLNADTPIYIVLIAMAIQSVGMGLFTSPNMNMTVSAVPQKFASHASAAQLTVRSIGQTMSLSLFTLVFSWIMGNLVLSTKYAGMIAQSLTIICEICTLACVISAIATAYGRKYNHSVNTE